MIEVAAALSGILQHWTDLFIILALLIFNAIVGFWQEHQAANAVFDRVQEVMTQKSKPKTLQLKPYLYRGLFRCGECGCFFTTETQKGHNYLRCTKRVSACTQKYVREEAIATQVDRAIERVTLEAALADQMVREA